MFCSIVLEILRGLAVVPDCLVATLLILVCLLEKPLFIATPCFFMLTSVSKAIILVKKENEEKKK